MTGGLFLSALLLTNLNGWFLFKETVNNKKEEFIADIAKIENSTFYEFSNSLLAKKINTYTDKPVYGYGNSTYPEKYKQIL